MAKQISEAGLTGWMAFFSAGAGAGVSTTLGNIDGDVSGFSLGVTIVMTVVGFIGLWATTKKLGQLPKRT